MWVAATPRAAPVAPPRAVEPAAPLVFDVQRFSVHDGPGIRTTVFLKGCPLRCAWCQNPEAMAAGPSLMTQAERCAGCGRCEAVCPSGAVRVKGTRTTDRSRCTSCGTCTAVCAYRACEVAGRAMTVLQVLDEVLRDREYYEAGHGGLTVSGGEPLLHHGFVAELLRGARAHGLHTCVQTCGHVRPAAFDEVLPHAQLIQFDLKHLDPRRHAALTGVPNDVILANARHLAAKGAPVQFRMPVIPAANDDEANVAATAGFLRELGHREVHLVPYRPYYHAKDRMLGQAPRPGFSSIDGDRRLAQVKAWFCAQGLDAVVDA